MSRLIAAKACLFVVCCLGPNQGEVFGQTDFFYSLADLNGGAQNSALNADFAQGDTGSLFVYYTTNGPVDADLDLVASLDIQSSVSGVIQFSDVETFEFPIQIADTTIGYRWTADGISGNGGAFGSDLSTVSDDFVESLAAFRVDGGVGLIEANTGPTFFDAGYDIDADAFLFGRIDFSVIGTVGDSTQLFTSPGALGLDTNGAGTPTFGAASINVVSSIPEPNATFLLLAGVCSSVLRRRRSTAKN